MNNEQLVASKMIRSFGHKRPKIIISNKALHSLKLGQLSVVYLMLYFASFRSVSQARHLLDAIPRLCVCLLLFVGWGGVRFPGEVGVLVHPRLR